MEKKAADALEMAEKAYAKRKEATSTTHNIILRIRFTHSAKLFFSLYFRISCEQSELEILKPQSI